MTEEDSTGEGTCPICGQPYDHKREESSNTATLRADAAQCKTASLGRKRTVYVHLDAERTVSREYPPLEKLNFPEPGQSVSKVRRKDDASSEGLATKIWRLFT